MGVEHSSSVAIGFEFDEDQLNEVFGYTQGEIAHMEPRFDQRTGVQIADEKVVDRRASTVFRIPGTEDEPCEDGLENFLMDYLAGYLGAHIDMSVNYWDGTIGNIVIGPKIPKGGYTLKNLNKMEPEFEKLREKLKALGLPPGDVVITTIDRVL